MRAETVCGPRFICERSKRLRIRKVGEQEVSRRLRRGERSQLLGLFVGTLGLPDNEDLTNVELEAGTLTELQPFRLRRFGQCTGCVVILRHPEMGRAVPRPAIQAPDLYASVCHGDAVGTIPPLIEMRLASRVVRGVVEVFRQFGVEWNAVRHHVLFDQAEFW